MLPLVTTTGAAVLQRLLDGLSAMWHPVVVAQLTQRVSCSKMLKLLVEIRDDENGVRIILWQQHWMCGGCGYCCMLWSSAAPKKTVGRKEEVKLANQGMLLFGVESFEDGIVML